MSVPAIRRLATTDSLAELTDLLHRAYASLAEMGMRFYASHQTVEQTRERVESGECFVLELDVRVVGTVTLYREFGHDEPAWYCRPDVAYFGQFAVEPSLQGRGFGNLLMEHVEKVALENGCMELALD